MSIGEVKRTIRSGNDAAKDAMRTLEQVASEAAITESLAQATIHNSGDDDAAAALETLAGIADEVTHAVRRIDAAIEHATAYHAALG